jgi:hypothetical protein
MEGVIGHAGDVAVFAMFELLEAQASIRQVFQRQLSLGQQWFRHGQHLQIRLCRGIPMCEVACNSSNTWILAVCSAIATKMVVVRGREA